MNRKFLSLVLALIGATTVAFAAVQQDSKAIDCGSTARLTASPKAGYHLVKWQDAGGDSLTNTLTLDIPNVSAAATYKAVFAPNTNTPYTVNHFLQNLDGSTYPVSPEATDNLTGTTGTQTAAAAKTYTGFTVQGFSQTTITGDGNATVNINYARNSYELKWDANGGTISGSAYISSNVLYGTAIAAPATDPVKDGYTFAGWNSVVAATMPASNTTYTATWTGAANTYTVKHYQQNLVGNEYTEVVADRQIIDTGKTGEQTQAVANSYTGFTAKAFSQQTIAVGGGTVIEIYYDRNTYTVAWVTDGNTLTGDYTTGSVRYGTTLVAPDEPTKNPSGNIVYSFSGWNNGTETLTTLPATVTADVTYTAVFQGTNQYTLTANSNNASLGSVTGTGTYNSGTSVTMVATPVNGCSVFLYWDDDHNNTDPSRQVEVTGNVTYTAVFQKVTYNITATTDDDTMGTVSITQQ